MALSEQAAKQLGYDKSAEERRREAKEKRRAERAAKEEAARIEKEKREEQRRQERAALEKKRASAMASDTMLETALEMLEEANSTLAEIRRDGEHRLERASADLRAAKHKATNLEAKLAEAREWYADRVAYAKKLEAELDETAVLERRTQAIARVQEAWDASEEAWSAVHTTWRKKNRNRQLKNAAKDALAKRAT